MKKRPKLYVIIFEGILLFVGSAIHQDSDFQIEVNATAPDAVLVIDNTIFKKHHGQTLISLYTTKEISKNVDATATRAEIPRHQDGEK